MNIRSRIAKLLFPIIGFVALVWFLIRVIPKPSRATYPCMRAAYPIASGFVIYIIGLAASVFAFQKFRANLKVSRYWIASVFFIIALTGGVFLIQSEKPFVYASTHYLDTPNQPIGTAQGVMPGRVVWAMDPDATNKNCGNNSLGDAYYLPQNTDMEVVHNLVTSSVLKLTEKNTVVEAWDALFKYFNIRKGKGDVGYQAVEKIFILTNAVGSIVQSSTDHKIYNLGNYTMARTAPQVVLAILRHLITNCGVAQGDISVGCPLDDISDDYYDLWNDEFPDVNYICHTGGQGRVKAVKGTNAIIKYSDQGDVLRSGDWGDASKGNPIYDDKTYKVIEEANYLINVAALKVHERAGVTLLGKCFFGSHTRESALHLHNGLINPDGQPVENPRRGGYGLYRVLVDLLGHEKLGDNAVLSIIDGLWGAPGANVRPEKFKIAPFNNDYTSSIFMSQDKIALESVCFDILKAEYTSDNHDITYPQMEGVDDYIHQAADPTTWPTGLQYDPEGDGTILTSLGVHEHWNNETDKQYTRNLGTGDGIELVYLNSPVPVEDHASPSNPTGFYLENNYPNPFNPSTTFRYHLTESAHVELTIYDAQGKRMKTIVDNELAKGIHEVSWNGDSEKGLRATSGCYFAKFSAKGNAGTYSQTIKIMLLK
ncbi:MAG: FlgD immunoglobulin-like domain containing protein [bacterium]